MIQTLGKPHAFSPSEPMQPYWAKIVEIVHEAPSVSTFWLEFLDTHLILARIPRYASQGRLSLQGWTIQHAAGARPG